MVASIPLPGVQIFSWKSVCVMFFNVQNLNFRVAPESEKTGFVLVVNLMPPLPLFQIIANCIFKSNHFWETLFCKNMPNFLTVRNSICLQNIKITFEQADFYARILLTQQLSRYSHNFSNTTRHTAMKFWLWTIAILWGKVGVIQESLADLKSIATPLNV